MKHAIHWIATNAAEFPRAWCGVAKPAAGSTALIEVTCQRCLRGCRGEEAIASTILHAYETARDESEVES